MIFLLNTAMVSPPFGGQKSVDFRKKIDLYAARIPRRGNPISGGLQAGCRRRNIEFSTPFGVVFHTVDVSIMAIHREQWVRDKIGYKKSHRTKSYGKFLSSKAILSLRKYLHKTRGFMLVNKIFTLL